MRINANIAANIGATSAANVRTILAIFSPDATNELPNPNVKDDDKPRIATVVIWIIPAEPPPAIIANDHCIIGSAYTKTIELIPIPDRTAAGDAMVSRRLSNQGI